MRGFWFSDPANRDWIVETVSLIIPHYVLWARVFFVSMVLVEGKWRREMNFVL